MNKLENNLRNIEVFLSETPIIGGVTKTLLGTIQATVALVIVIIAALPSLCGHKTSQKWLSRAGEHIVHGIGNIVIGGLEIFPLLWCLSYNIRKALGQEFSISGSGLGLYMDYGSLSSHCQYGKESPKISFSSNVTKNV